MASNTTKDGLGLSENAIIAHLQGDWHARKQLQTCSQGRGYLDDGTRGGANVTDPGDVGWWRRWGCAWCTLRYELKNCWHGGVGLQELHGYGRGERNPTVFGGAELHRAPITPADDGIIGQG